MHLFTTKNSVSSFPFFSLFPLSSHMKKITKKLISLSAALLLTFSFSITALADTWTYSLRSTSEIASGKNDPTESVMVGQDNITVWDMNVNDKLVLIDSKNIPEDAKFYVDICARRTNTGNYHYYTTNRLLVGDAKIGMEHDLYKVVEDFWEGEHGKTLTALYPLDNNPEDTLWGLVISNGQSMSNNYIWFRFVGTRNAAQTTDKGYGDWASDDNGWWIQYADGTYLVNGWWKSPYSGLWYYMGADGYMVTNTIVDGYMINSDGVWVE